MFCFGVFTVIFFLIQTIIAEFPSIKNIDLFLAKQVQLLSPQDIKRSKILSLSKIKFEELFLDFQELQHICSSSKLLNNNQIQLNSEDLYYLIDTLAYFNCTDTTIDKPFLQSIKEQSKSPQSIYYLSLVKNLLHDKDLKSVLNDLNYSSNVATTHDKIYTLMNACTISGTPKPDIDNLIADISNTIFKESSLDGTENTIIVSKFLSALIDCDKLPILKDEQLVNILKHIEGISYDISVLHVLSPLLHRLSACNSTIYPQLRSEQYFKNDDKKTAKIYVINRFTSELLSEQISVDLHDVKCDNKKVSLKEAIFNINKGFVSISVDKSYTECLFLLKLKPSRSITFIGKKEEEVIVSSRKAIDLVDIGVSFTDSLDLDMFNSQSVSFNSKISDLVKGNLIKFAIEFYATSSNVRFLPSQVFLNLYKENSNTMVSFIASVRGGNRLRCEFDIDAVGNQSFNYLSGLYSMELVIGHSSAILLKWNMGDFKIIFSKSSTIFNRDHVVLPELHNFPTILYKQPFTVISLLFTLIVLGLGVIVFPLWSFTGFKIEFKFSIWRVIFFTSLAGLFYIYYCYWRYMNGFEALQYSAPVAVVMLLSLNYILDINTNV